MAAPASAPERTPERTDEERFTAFFSPKHMSYGVWDRRDDIYVWANNSASQEVAGGLATWLNAVIPTEMQGWTVAQMLAPVSVLDNLIRRPR